LTNKSSCVIIKVQKRDNKEFKIMKYRVYNENNWSKLMGQYFPTYFYTKREAVAHAEKIGGNAVIERKIGADWVAY